MKEDDKEPRQKKPKKEKEPGNRVNFRWVGLIFGLTIVISACFSALSGALLSGAAMVGAFAVLLVIVLIGIVFDILGVAVTTADERPFHSMAARNLPEAKEAIRLIRNAERVSSICNDVVGDICGVVSGSASAVIAAQVIVNFQPTAASFAQLLMSALVSGLTVGGKAVGKTFAINVSTPIVHFAAKVIYRVKYLPKWLRSAFSRRH